MAATKKSTTTKASTAKTTASKSSSRWSAASKNKSNGITISPANFSTGDKIKVTYTGLLSQSGANEDYAHIGWGDSWENVDDVKMSKTKTGFSTTITAYNSALNLCFKDTCDNWDNNNGNNYTIYCD